MGKFIFLSLPTLLAKSFVGMFNQLTLAAATALAAVWLVSGSRDQVYVPPHEAPVDGFMAMAVSNSAASSPGSLMLKHEDQKATHGDIAEVVPNTDRLDCLRQDELDLVVPHTDDQVVRMVLGLGASTASDIYISATDIVIKKLTANFRLNRKDRNMFEIEIDGDEQYKGQGVASVN